MKIAVFSDIHANIHALEAVLRNIERQRPARVFCLGDLVGYGAYPNEVIERLRELEIPTIMGNYDDGVGYERGECGCAYQTPEDRQRGHQSIEWTTRTVTPQNKAFLRALPLNLEVNRNGIHVKLVHGSPRRINEYLYEDRPLATFEKVLEAAGSDILVCGHTHLPYHRIIAGRHVVNDGSVGKPKHGDPRACYITLTLNGRPEVEFHYVEYDFEAAATAVEAVGLPREFADALRFGRG